MDMNTRLSPLTLVEISIKKSRAERGFGQSTIAYDSLEWIDVDMSTGRGGSVIYAKYEVRENESRLAARQRHEGERRVTEGFCAARQHRVELLGGIRRLID